MDQSLRARGWHLTEEGIAKIGDSKAGLEKLVADALNTDLRQIGCQSLPEDINKDKITVPCVLQIQKTRNLSAPKDNESSGHAPQLLKLTLTDGKKSCTALQLEAIPDLSLNTPPGSKLQLSGQVVVRQGMLMLNSTNTKCLGGWVKELVSKWKMARSLAAHQREAGTRGRGGPPPWVPFGHSKSRNAPNVQQDFKSLVTPEKDKERTEDDREFEEQRKATIEELSQAGEGGRRTFGGGSVAAQNLQREQQQRRDQRQAAIYRDLATGRASLEVDQVAVKRLMEMGFTYNPAVNALKSNRNNFDDALNFLLGNADGPDTEPAATDGFPPRQQGGGGRGGGKPGRRKGRRGRYGDDDDDDDMEDYNLPRSSGASTLFDYLENRLSEVGLSVNEKKSSAAGGPNLHKEYGDDFSRQSVLSQPGKSYEAPNDREHNYSTSGKVEPAPYRRNQLDRRTAHEPPGVGGDKDYGKYGGANSGNSWRRQPGDREKLMENANHPGSQRDRGNFRDDVGSGGTRSEFRGQQARSETRGYPKAREAGFRGRESRDSFEERRTPNEQTKGASGKKEVGRPGNMSQRPNSNNFKKTYPVNQPREDHQPSTGNSKVKRQPVVGAPPAWKIGDHCLAKYWEDRQYYQAVIDAFNHEKTFCVVIFTEYGNYEEVSVEDLKQSLPKQAWVSSGQEHVGNLPTAPLAVNPHPQSYLSTSEGGSYGGPLGTGLEFKPSNNKAGASKDSSGTSGEGRRPPTRPQSRPQKLLYHAPGARK